MKHKLLLFTEQFPFGENTETAFLQHEIKYLIKKFDVTIVPYGFDPKKKLIPGYNIDRSLRTALSEKNNLKKVLTSLNSRLFFQEFTSKKIYHWNKNKFKRLFYYIERAETVKDWFLYSYGKIAHTQKICLYTYWNNEITLGLGLSKNGLLNSRLISRAHAHDLYENIHFFGYIPCFETNLKYVDKFYPVSNEGLTYINEKYPGYGKKVSTRYLGVDACISESFTSEDGIIRIVSCSYLIRRKRVDLIVKGIASFIKRYGYHISWTHFGNGPQESEIKTLAIENKSEKFNFVFKGFVPNTDVLKYYSENPVDIFITASAGEGLPVSLQEAQAHGIPVIGTAVNGIPEIVNERVGVLISRNPTPNEIADAIYFIINDKTRFMAMRKNSIKNWEKKFNADTNYQNFSNAISCL